METPIYIPRPSNELVAFIEQTQVQKRYRMHEICEKYRKLINS